LLKQWEVFICLFCTYFFKEAQEQEEEEEKEKGSEKISSVERPEFNFTSLIDIPKYAYGVSLESFYFFFYCQID
jgi:hypothetical protein